jgi:hypothetical protein
MRVLSQFWRIYRTAAPGKRLVALRAALRRKMAPAVSDGLIVYKLDEQAYRAGKLVPWPEGLSVTRYETLDAIPPAVRETVEPDVRERLWSEFASEFANGGVLWIGQIGGTLAASQWCIRGSRLGPWYVPLQPNDLVIYAAGTQNAFRGRGIHPAMIRYIMEHEPHDGGAIYCDALAWNVVAQKNIEKAGYRPILHTSPAR